MRINYVRIENFRNFKLLEVHTGQNIVIAGENKAGKSNFIHALRLILDPSLSDTDRYLTEQDFWDGEDPFMGKQIKIVIQLTDFADDPNPDFLPMSLLDSRCIVQTDPQKVAQLTYVYYNSKRLDEPEKSDINDYEYMIYGGNDDSKPLENIRILRKNIPLLLITAYRDIASDNRVWRRSPLSSLVELTNLKIDELQPFADQVKSVSENVLMVPEIYSLEIDIQTRLKKMVGDLYDVDPALGLNATTAQAMQEDLRLFTEGDKRRSLERTSLGMQNTLYLALLSLLVEKQEIKRAQNEERYLPIIALEEPEAHLHPHLQRLVFDDFLESATNRKQPVIISTHSPHLVSSAQVGDLVLLKEKAHEGCLAKSAYTFMKNLQERERKDLERFLDITKSEMLFSKGVIFVEGDAETLLIHVFAEILGKRLDQFGLSVCNVSGTQFSHVITLAHQFDIPFIVLTDGDKLLEYSGIMRSLDLLRCINPNISDLLNKKYEAGEFEDVQNSLRSYGIFVNEWTFELTLFDSGLRDAYKSTFEELANEIDVNLRAGIKHIDEYIAVRSDENGKRLLTSIGDPRWGKGRFAQRLIKHIQLTANSIESPEARYSLVPEYIRAGIEYLITKVLAGKTAL